ncbi:RloB domain-containing protein [Vibrio fluvialis]|nr:RloB domain-containing protein [Vibrio fluvialis]
MPLIRPENRGSKFRQKQIDPIVVHIAYEGMVTEDEYFKAVESSVQKRYRHIIKFVPVPKSNTNSNPESVLNDLEVHLKQNKINLNRSKSHLGFICIDTDHHFSGRHSAKTMETIKKCRQKGIGVALTNPCFEIWLMCHYNDILSLGENFCHDLLDNRKKGTSTFSKSELAKMRGVETLHDLVLKWEMALENEQTLNSVCPSADAIPATGLYSGIGKIFKIFKDSNIDLFK